MDRATEEETAATGRRILVAVDEGDESVHALKWCLASFAKRGAGAAPAADTIILLYVRPPPPTYSVLDASGTYAMSLVDSFFSLSPSLFDRPILAMVGYVFSDEVAAAIDGYSKEVAEAVVEKAQKLCTLYGKEVGGDDEAGHEMKVEVKVAVGDARNVICQMVDKLGADVLVMGSHGYGLFKRALLGSVSDYCVRNANCPVLIVKS